MLSKLVIAWDLDGTLVDSSHRIKFLNNGDFDLCHWVDTSNNLDMVMKDTLLPLVEVYRSFKKAGYTQICVTARDMTKCDYEFLSKNDLLFDMILHRGDSLELCHILKSRRLKDYFNLSGKIPFMAFDDNEDNLNVFDNFGFRTFHALTVNEKIKNSFLHETYFDSSDFS